MYHFSKNKRRLSIATTALLFVMMSSNAFGGDYYHLRRPVQHYVNIHLAAGGVSPFLNNVVAPPQTSESPRVIAGVGGNAAFGLSYELRYHKFFFNVGAELDGDLQVFNLKAFTDTIHNDWLPSKDHDRAVNQTNTYMYQHTDFKEKDYELRGAIPVQFGYLFNSYFYGAVGVKYSVAFQNYYEAQSTIQTTMMLNNAISFNGEPIQVSADSKQATLYGIFPSDTYTFNSKTQNTLALLRMISPTVELGGRIPLAYRTVLRVGAYAEYGIPIGWESDPNRKHVVYENIWALWNNPSYVRKAEDLQLLGVNPIKNSDWTTTGFKTLTIGVRATLSFNITPTKHWCNCEKEFGIHPKRGGGRIER